MRVHVVTSVFLACLGCGGANQGPDGDASGSTGEGSSSTGAATDSDGESTGTSVTSGEGSGSSGDESGGESTGTSGVPTQCPEPPAALSRWVTGNEDDADVTPTGPGVILMGGGSDAIGAFQWWKDYISGGDVVVLRASGDDGYNSFLYNQVGGADSVETLVIDSRELADDPYVTCRVAQAEAVFMAGGNQADYMSSWKGRGLATAMMQAYERGAIVGGTSAGLAVLGTWVYAAYRGSVQSWEMLANPYNDSATLDQALLDIPLLDAVITDSHFRGRNRLGRLVGFLARIVQDGWGEAPLGIGVDEATALVVGPDGTGRVVGSGGVYLVRTSGGPETCSPGTPLTYTGLELVELGGGDEVRLPEGETEIEGTPLAAVEGALDPDPFE